MAATTTEQPTTGRQQIVAPTVGRQQIVAPSPGTAFDPKTLLPAVLDLVHAAALLGVGRTTAYRLVHDGQWPTPVLRLGRQIKIPTQPLLNLLAGRTPNAA